MMKLNNPRPGRIRLFRKHVNFLLEWTLGDSEKIIWSWINHLVSTEIADNVLAKNHHISDKKIRNSQTKNIRLYIQQAYELYEAAKFTKANTAPLFYYYSFLNLAKALCEIIYPDFHKRNESSKHGLSWKPNNRPAVKFDIEKVDLTTRGVWHCLLEFLSKSKKVVPNPVSLKIKDLFSFCPEISSEYKSSCGEDSRIIFLEEPSILIDNNNCWIRFSIDKNKLSDLQISKKKFLSLISKSAGNYEEIKPHSSILHSFQLKNVKPYSPQDENSAYEALSDEILNLNLFTILQAKKNIYYVPTQHKLIFKVPQLLAMYTIFFWLSSLVRYNPHGMESIQRSKYWFLVDGFMNQSRLWLLELFAWEFYNTEKVLLNSRM